MMRATVTAAAALFLMASCATSEDVSTAEHPICTDEDQQSGSCPWAGWSPPYRQHADYTADQVAQQSGSTPQHSTCSTAGPQQAQWSVTCVAWNTQSAITCSFLWQLVDGVIVLAYVACNPGPGSSPG